MFLQNQIVPQKSKALECWFSIKGNQSNSNLSGVGVLSTQGKNNQGLKAISGIENEFGERDFCKEHNLNTWRYYYGNGS